MSNDIFSKRFQKYLCISCGICAGLFPEKIYMRYERNVGMFFPFLVSDALNEEISEAIKEICPGYGYSLIENTDIKKSEKYSLEMGFYHNLFAAQSSDQDVLVNASSGGVMSEISLYLLENKLVDGVVVTDMRYDNEMPEPVSYIARSREQVLQAQGSKYCPSPTMLIVDEIIKNPGNYAVIGTPCQLAGLETARRKYKRLDDSIYLTIANFCGGFRDFRETERLIKKNNLKVQDVISLSYRGGGQPGFMTILAKDGNKVMLPYPQYAKMTGIMKSYRCRTCVDATGELADISCGDAWLDDYINRDQGWSVIITRNQKSDQLIKSMIKKSLIKCEPLSKEDVILSQKTNITTKKYRQLARRKLYSFLGIPLPDFGGGYVNSNLGLLFEIKVHISTSIFHLAEIFGVYDVLMKLIKRKA